MDDCRMLENRIQELERRLKRTRQMGTMCVLAIVSAGVIGAAGAQDRKDKEVVDLLRVKRIHVLDEDGAIRMALGQDPKGGQRKSRAVGLTLYDKKSERGGFATMDDGTVVLAMDAPQGVGAPMPDRLGMAVHSDGSAHVLLVDNQTCGVAKLYSDGKGGGGVQVFKWDLPQKKVHIKTLTYDGEEKNTQATGG